MFSLFSSQIFAGNADECNFLKDKDDPAYTPGLYGLCIAWHNADEDDAEALADKFFERAGFVVPGYPVVPDINDDEQDLTFDCPCWDGVELLSVCALGQARVTVDAQTGEIIGATFLNLVSFTAEGFGTGEGHCAHVIQDLITNNYLYENYNNDQPLTADEALDCQAELDIIAEIHLNEECPDS